MPEGDAVWLTARRLHQALAGRVLTRSDFRVPRYATTNLTGRMVTEAVSRGKHLLIRTGDGITVHTHLRMDGSWRVRPARDRVASSHRIRLILANSEWQAVGYQLGVVEVLPTSSEHMVVGYLGPDLLGPDWDPAEAMSRLLADPARPVGEALLDQRNLAGIGNVYKAEVLFLRGIDPWRPVGEVADVAALVEPGPPAAGREQGAVRHGHHGRGAARRRNLGVRPRGPPLPPLRHPGRSRRPGPQPAGADHILVPALPVLTASTALG